MLLYGLTESPGDAKPRLLHHQTTPAAAGAAAAAAGAKVVRVLG